MKSRKEILEQIRESTLAKLFELEVRLEIADSFRLALVKPEEEKLRLQMEAERGELLFEIDKRKKAVEILERKIKEESNG